MPLVTFIYSYKLSTVYGLDKATMAARLNYSMFALQIEILAWGGILNLNCKILFFYQTRAYY